MCRRNSNEATAFGRRVATRYYFVQPDCDLCGCLCLARPNLAAAFFFFVFFLLLLSSRPAVPLDGCRAKRGGWDDDATAAAFAFLRLTLFLLFFFSVAGSVSPSSHLTTRPEAAAAAMLSGVAWASRSYTYVYSATRALAAPQLSLPQRE